VNSLDIQGILELLPHRYPLLLVDRVLEFEPGVSLTAIKNVTMNEPHFCGHFPVEPVMPGVLMIEALAQAACVLGYKSTETSYKNGDLYLFAGANNIRFKRIVKPGDQLRLDIEVLKVRGELIKVQGIASVDDEMACSAEIVSIMRRGDASDT
tara:strand:+ start:64172 stop:64630 length:459 start_codon:yes stop_codon:yes gene_type:complete